MSKPHVSSPPASIIEQGLAPVPVGPSFTIHWLAVAGCQPAIAENPARAAPPLDCGMGAVGGGSGAPIKRRRLGSEVSLGTWSQQCGLAGGGGRGWLHPVAFRTANYEGIPCALVKLME